MRLADLSNRHDIVEHITHRPIAVFSRFFIVGNGRYLNLFEIFRLFDLDIEMPRNNIARFIDFDNIHVFDYPEIRTMNRQRTGNKITDDHIGRQMFPLVNGFSQ